MSRALNLNATQADVLQSCSKHAVTISTIETLPSGCTRVVLRNGEDAETLRRAFRGKVIDGPVGRTPLTVVRWRSEAPTTPFARDEAPRSRA
jgi:hypothetical protein